MKECNVKIEEQWIIWMKRTKVNAFFTLSLMLLMLTLYNEIECQQGKQMMHIRRKENVIEETETNKE